MEGLLKISPSKRAFKAKNVDDQPLPAQLLNRPIDFNTVTEDNYGQGGVGGSEAPMAGEGLRYTDIKSTLKSKADAMLPFFGQECTIKTFHSKWQFREEGVNKFIEQIPAVFEKGKAEGSMSQVNSAVLSTIVEVFKDKVQQIIMLSFDASE